jgi:hypothetical protein
MPPRNADSLLDLEYHGGRLKRLRIGHSAATVLIVLALVAAAALAGGRFTWHDVFRMLPSLIRP